ncbi:MAG: type II toxin-antitoxin system VapC family toxin [Chitinivibrionia bacterium]|nr:type II toxin-antitoxin system VapC family toxin [Chitinivibrionia bacterium]
MTVVLDVSGIMQILLGTSKMDKFNDVLQRATFILAPDLYMSELSNTLLKYYFAEELSKDVCLKHIQNGIDIVDNFISAKEIWQDAFCAGIENRHSIYDMMYVITAKKYNATLITNDNKLSAICENNNVKVLI